YTYWGYRYPTAQQQAEYAASSYVFPSALGEGGNLPQGAITSDLWDGASVTFTREGNDIILNGTHYPVRESKAMVGAEAAYAGQRFTPVSTTNGVSISFDYSNYGADWISVLHGDGFRLALGVLYETAGD
ncbi:MAG: hypothetical protein K2J30_05085, partial [Clostridia bacterium]|nr:hypothetical protein [Clostridia bacterium]